MNMKAFMTMYRGIQIGVIFTVPPGQEHRAEEEWNKLEYYLEQFYQDTEK